MTRIGQNPAKIGMQAYQPQKLGLATITYIPSMEGYFRDSLAILKLTLESLHQNTSEPFDLLVFDNGSCAEVQNELTQLHHEGAIRWLILSNDNLGKTGAQNSILFCHAERMDRLYRFRCPVSQGLVGSFTQDHCAFPRRRHGWSTTLLF